MGMQTMTYEVGLWVVSAAHNSFPRRRGERRPNGWRRRLLASSDELRKCNGKAHVKCKKKALSDEIYVCVKLTLNEVAAVRLAGLPLPGKLSADEKTWPKQAARPRSTRSLSLIHI